MNAKIYFWKKAPFVRLLIPLVTGISAQWFFQVAPFVWYSLLALSFFSAVIFFYFPLFKKYHLGFLNGITTLVSFMALGALLVWYNDIRHAVNWVGHRYNDNSFLAATLTQTPVEKAKSFKSVAAITYLIHNEKRTPAKGMIILYFKKDSLPLLVTQGSQIIFKKPLQEIKNSGNPGGFDFKRYALFQGITHQVYLERGEFIVLHETSKDWLYAFLDKLRLQVLNILRANIRSEKELGLAEALLIGYKDDLDKTLVQSYTNTGVVHIIAISGLHLGLIYWLLVCLLRPLQHRKYGKWVRPLFILCGLWLFALLAGAQPSILRSAVMFTCIVLGENLTRKTSIYNTLALSAFLLLLYNPYWLWDVGFQLSYSAVLSIVIFMQPVYNLLYIKNKLLDLLWKLNAVTIAAQLLTIPVSMYHFHQFPTLFVFTNFVAVPLSSVILLGLIFLCLVSFIPSIALLTGRILSWLMQLMTDYIEEIESISFSLWDGLQVNMPQVIFLFVFIAGISHWFFEKTRTSLLTGLFGLCAFFIIRTHSFWKASGQQKVVVYNISKHQAIDFIDGRRFYFTGDKYLLKNDFARNFHLKPSRTLQRAGSVSSFDNLSIDRPVLFGNKAILLADSSFSFASSSTRRQVDLFIVSGNPKLYLARLYRSFDIKKVVFDGSISAGRIKHWKKDCDSLHIPYHDVTEKGAFVMNLN